MKIIEGNKNMVPRDYKIKGKVEWDNEVPKLVEPEFGGIVSTPNLDYKEFEQKQVTILKCPK